MGLAGPKIKQRIGADPQNKQWAAQNKGMSLLRSMGWNGKGLGTNEQGNVKSISVVLKNDTEGIGAATNSSDGWLENSSAFDDLLKSLNSKNVNSTSEGSKNIEKKSENTEISQDESNYTEYKLKDINTSISQPIIEHSRSGRLYSRTKFLRNKMVSNYDQESINNILGLKRNGDASGF